MNQEIPKPKKVLFVITKATWGGAQRYVLDLVRSLPSDRYVPIVAYGRSGQLSVELGKRDIAMRQIHSLDRDISLTADAASFFDILSCIRKESPDIVHLNSSKAAALGALAAWLNQVPRIVFTVHGWPHKERHNFIFKGLLYFLSWFTALLSDCVIVVSLTDAAIGKKMWFIGHKIEYIPIGIDIPAFLSKEEALAAVWGMVSSEKMPREAIRIVTIAELTPNKGIRYAIEAMADLSRKTEDHFIYLVIGEGEERKYLEQLVRLHHIDDKIFFLGFMQNACLYLRAFDVFLLPSVKEGMPYVLLEAGESGIPIVATDAVNPEIKERYSNVRIVRTENGFALADAIRSAAQNKVEAASMQGAPHFPLTEMVQKTISVYEDSFIIIR